MMGRLFVLVALVAGCRVAGSFPCASDEQCRRGGVTGICGPAGYCAFLDGECASQWRYDDTAASYAGTCVEADQTMPDAAIAMIDAPPSPPFDISMCPSTYTRQLQSTMGTSRYRLITMQAMFVSHAGNCDDDLPGATHLVFPDTLQELIELSQWIDPINNTGAFFFVGAVQARNAPSLGAGWILFDDTPLDAGLWEAGDPDDGDDIEDGTEQLAMFDKTPNVRRLNDTAGTTMRGAICECDGRKWGPMATSILNGQ